MVSTEVTLKNFSSLSHFKSEFSSNYQSSYPDQKSKTKAKLSSFKSLSKLLPSSGGNLNNCLSSLNVCQQGINQCAQENTNTKETLLPTKLDLKCHLKNCSVVPEPSGSYAFFDECEKISKHKYSGSDLAEDIKAHIRSGYLWEVANINRTRQVKHKEGRQQPRTGRKIVEIKHEGLDLTKDFDVSGLTLDD